MYLLRTRNLANLIFTMMLLLGAQAQARVFSFNESWIAPYIGGTMGPSSVGADAFSKTSGDDSDFRAQDKVEYNFSGEFGVTLLFSESLHLRVGLEGVKPRDRHGLGYQRSATPDKLMLEVDSAILALSPQATAEIAYYKTNTSRAYAFFGGGISNVKVTNEYTTTADGQFLYDPGLPNVPATYDDVWVAQVLKFHLGTGYEIHALDNVTFSFELGYRMLKIDEFTYDSDGVVIRGQNAVEVTKGSAVKSNNDQTVSLDLSGIYLGLIMRFYIPPMN